MKQRVADALARAPRFGEPIARVCKVCRGHAPVFDSLDFYRACQPHVFGVSEIAVPYFRCTDCDFLFTDFCDDWTEADFARWIYNDDYIKVDGEYLEARPRRAAAEIAALFRGLEGARILDYGSGQGVFTATMRQHGFSDIAGYDPFSQPQRPDGKFDIVTCFEVVEHTARPLETFAEMVRYLKPGGALLIGQCVQPDNIMQIRGAWWYLAPRNGHISTYSHRTLYRIAEGLGCRLRIRDGLYLFRNLDENEKLKALEAHFVSMARTLKLLATGEDGWHGRETTPDGAFRWTSHDTVSWPNQPFEAGCTEIHIPFLHEIEPNFAARCIVTVGGADVETRAVGGQIIAVAAADQPHRADVVLKQPPLICPRSRGVPDDRMLGLAVRA